MYERPKHIDKPTFSKTPVVRVERTEEISEHHFKNVSTLLLLVFVETTASTIHKLLVSS